MDYNSVIVCLPNDKNINSFIVQMSMNIKRRISVGRNCKKRNCMFALLGGWKEEYSSRGRN